MSIGERLYAELYMRVINEMHPDAAARELNVCLCYMRIQILIPFNFQTKISIMNKQIFN